MKFLTDAIRQHENPIHIVDVGASPFGEQPSYREIAKLDICQIIGFEPDAQAYQELIKNQLPNQRYFQEFVGDGNCHTFHETNYSPTSSLLKPNTPVISQFHGLGEYMEVLNIKAVQTTRLDDLEEISQIDFLKIDVQGAELQVFQGAKNLLGSTLLIQTEIEFVELYENQPLFADIDNYLRTLGFVFHCFADSPMGRAFKPLMVNNDKHAKVNQCLWADAIYVRDWLKLEHLTDSQILKYAILALSIAKSPDLSMKALLLFDERNSTELASKFLDFLQSK